MKNANVAIGLPMYSSQIEINCITPCFKALIQPENPVSVIIKQVGDSLVTRARNNIVARFLYENTECTHLMFIDSDIEFHENDIKRLVSHDKPIVGGVYLKKKFPYTAVMNTVDEMHGSLAKVKETGTGFLLIQRHVFNRMIERVNIPEYKPCSDEEQLPAVHDFFRVGVVGETYLSEDYYFCHLAQMAGFDIWLDTELIVKHHGKTVFPYDDDAMIRHVEDYTRQLSTEYPVDKGILNRIRENVNNQIEGRK